MLLFGTRIVLFNHDQSEFFLLEIQFANFLPEEKANFLCVLKYQNASWSQTQMIFTTVFALPYDEKKNNQNNSVIHLKSDPPGCSP